MGVTHDVNPECQKDFININEKLLDLSKKVTNLDGFFENTFTIMTRLEMITTQQEKWIEKKDIRDEKRDELLLEISHTLRDIKADQSYTQKSIDSIKKEIGQQSNDNTIKVSGLIKNIIIFAIGAIITAIVASFMSGAV
jgi:hypothetical protein